VDDIVLTGNDSVEMKRLKASLAKEFEMKDLGELRYFTKGLSIIDFSNVIDKMSMINIYASS
jgi:Reverse transcriptase (RNA-dependent DNA polymerase)